MSTEAVGTQGAVEREVGGKVLRLVRDDITAMEIEAFVHDITADLKLGAGFGSAIQRRGGIVIQKELDEIGSLAVGQAVATQAGILKAEHIIHVNGPKFREEDESGKLRLAVSNALRLAEEKGVKRLAIPPIGTGLYQVPVDLCARVMVETILKHMQKDSCLEEVLLVTTDGRDYEPFRKQLEEGA